MEARWSFDFADINFGAFWAIFIITMKRGFEQENRYTLSKHATEFKNKVTLCQTFSVKMSGLVTRFNLTASKTRVFEHNILLILFKVKVLIENDEERATLYEALRGYQG